MEYNSNILMNNGGLMFNYAILSDIHGNLPALKEVIKDLEKYDIKGVILLGDLIDYGMQSNGVVEYIADNFSEKILCNLWGNHEKTILTSDYSQFSSERGIQSAKFTKSQLSSDVKNYLVNELNQNGFHEFKLKDKLLLAIHGSLENYYWKSIDLSNIGGDYSKYDIVLSGHSHYPHVFQKIYSINNPLMRNKKFVMFINPGSVGQPRNQNPNAQYAILDIDSMSVSLNAVDYPIKKSMELYDGNIDNFYCERLMRGI